MDVSNKPHLHRTRYPQPLQLRAQRHVPRKGHTRAQSDEVTDVSAGDANQSGRGGEFVGFPLGQWDPQTMGPFHVRLDWAREAWVSSIWRLECARRWWP